MTPDAVLRMTALGLSVIPLYGPRDGHCSCEDPNCDKPAKHPTQKWKVYQQRIAGDADIRHWFGNGASRNVGIVTGQLSGIVVVDLDSPKADTP